MDISELDENFKTDFQQLDDIEWYDVLKSPFSLFGVNYCEREGQYHRMPKSVADKVKNSWLT